MIFNEENVFLLGMSDPPSGWQRVPQGETRGGEWFLMPTLEAYPQETYYRTAYEPGRGPDAFTMLVGETYVAGIPSSEFSPGFNE